MDGTKDTGTPHQGPALRGSPRKAALPQVRRSHAGNGERQSPRRRRAGRARRGHLLAPRHPRGAPGGVVMTALALIPVVGAALVWGPVAVYLLLTGDCWDGGILLAYGSTVIGLADNILRRFSSAGTPSCRTSSCCCPRWGDSSFFRHGRLRHQAHARRAVRDLADFHLRSSGQTRRFPPLLPLYPALSPSGRSRIVPSPRKQRKARHRANPEGNGNPFENGKARPPDSRPLRYTLTPKFLRNGKPA